jgi:hypothetical protein
MGKLGKKEVVEALNNLVRNCHSISILFSSSDTATGF